MTPEIERRVLTTPRFAAGRRRARLLTVLDAMSAIEHTLDSEEPDWNFLLTAASFLVESDEEESQAAVLEVAQGCLVSSDAAEYQRAAAAVLFERLGNRPAVRLAEEKGIVSSDAWRIEPSIAREVIKTRLELSVPSITGASFDVNRFQRDFWATARRSKWMSVSAPTAAGKSYIMRRWIEERLAETEHFRCVYLVPTRALIEEVARELYHQLGRTAGVRTLPWDDEIGSSAKEIFVFTQERLHLRLQQDPELVIDLILVDEAQKFGDDSRGVLLQRVLDELIQRKPDSQVVFASPLSSNPEVLLEASPPEVESSSLVGQTVTVTQNLLWVNQVPQNPRLWNVDLVDGEQDTRLGRIRLQARPQLRSKRLSLIAVALGRNAHSNVIYVNGQAQAETTARQVFEALGGEADVSDHPRVRALRELCQKTIHDRYALVDVINRGVGFHYGNIPLLVRTEVESMFRDGVLRYLICTSTLLEGVNFPCQTMFVLGPERGPRQQMSPADFWNLAGRAGRWGQEFAGNIVCIDTVKEDKWPNPPRQRVRYPLTRATDKFLSNTTDLLRYIASGAPADERDRALLEAVFSLISARRTSNRRLADLPGVGDDAAVQLEAAVDAALADIEVPRTIVERHAGISPISMQRLLDDFASRDNPTELLVAPPESDDALTTLLKAIGRISRHLGGDFGTSRRQYALALLITRWMRGAPLARLISDRVDYYKSRSNPPRLATTIRNTMADVEKVARFEAPKYLACYLDLLRFEFGRRGIANQIVDLPDVSMLLELGVSRTTELSMIALGLSRTSAVALSEHVIDDELSTQQCLQWLRQRDLEALALPVLVQHEIEALLQRRPESAATETGDPAS